MSFQPTEFKFDMGYMNTPYFSYRNPNPQFFQNYHDSSTRCISTLLDISYYDALNLQFQFCRKRCNSFYDELNVYDILNLHGFSLGNIISLDSSINILSFIQKYQSRYKYLCFFAPPLFVPVISGIIFDIRNYGNIRFKKYMYKNCL